jgi:hypothetical protein
MAVRTGRIVPGSIHLVRGADHQPNGDNTTGVMVVRMLVDHDGTDLTTSDTLQWTNVPAAIAAAFANAKTYTIRGVMCTGAARNKTDGADVGLKTVAFSGSTITAVQTTNDWSTVADVDTTDVLAPAWTLDVSVTAEDAS